LKGCMHSEMRCRRFDFASTVSRLLRENTIKQGVFYASVPIVPHHPQASQSRLLSQASAVAMVSEALGLTV